MEGRRRLSRAVDKAGNVLLTIVLVAGICAAGVLVWEVVQCLLN